PAIAEGVTRWRHAFDVAAARLQRRDLPPGDAATALALRREAALQAIDELQQRLIQAGIIDMDDLPATATAPAEDQGGQATHFVSSGAREELTLILASSPSSSAVPTSQLAGLLLAGGLVVWSLTPWPLARNWLVT